MRIENLLDPASIITKGRLLEDFEFDGMTFSAGTNASFYISDNHLRKGWLKNDVEKFGRKLKGYFCYIRTVDEEGNPITIYESIVAEPFELNDDQNKGYPIDYVIRFNSDGEIIN